MKPFMKILLPAVGLAVMGTLADCSSLSSLPQGPQGYKVVAGSRSSAPSWINSIGEYTHKQDEKKENRGAVWFTASSPLENTLQGAKHDAYVRAMRKASERIADQTWNIVGNSVSRRLNPDLQIMHRLRDVTKTRLRAESQGWLVGGEEYMYYWIEYQPKHKEMATQGNQSLYRSWALVRFNHNNWECSRRNSLKLLPMVQSDLGGKFGFKKFDQKTYLGVLKDITDKNIQLIPDQVCTGG